MVISYIVVVNVFGKKELTVGFTPSPVLFTQCSEYSLGGRLFLAHASLVDRTQLASILL